MNIIFGSASGIGQSLYQEYLINEREVFGIDIIESPTTNYIYNLENLENISDLVYHFKESNIESITFCASNQNQGDFIENIFKTNVLTFIEFINLIYPKLDGCIISAISSVHSISSNPSNLYYSSSKAALEAAIRNLAIRKSNNSFYVIRLGATDTKKLRENIDDIELLSTLLPSGNVFDKKEVSNFIYTLNTKFKNLLNGAVIQIDNGVLSMLKTN
jgi:NAD(P)-dependent dehydrogenase (short-subunit alcohol dehydrogenase family)